MKKSLLRALTITLLTISICVWSFSAIAQPANDDCSNAISLTIHSITDCPANAITVDNTNATESTEATPSCENGNQGYKDVFFTFVAPASGEINFSIPSNSGPNIEGAIKDACGGTIEFYCQNQGGNGIDGNTVSGLTSGVTYLLQLWTTNSGGVFELCITATPPPPPGNDDCATAETIACGQTLSGSTTFASVETSCIGVNPISNGVWYTFIGTNSSDPGALPGEPGDQVTMSTCGQANYDTKITIFSQGCAGLVCEGGNDDVVGCSNFTSVFTFPTSVGEIYHVLVSGWSITDFGAFDLSMSCDSPCLPIPANDDCANAEPLAVDPFGAVMMTEGTNECAPSVPAFANCDQLGYFQAVWYSFNSGIHDSVSIFINDITVTNLNLAVYNGCGGSEIFCQAEPINSPEIISTLPGTDYFVAVFTNPYRDGPVAGSFEIGIEAPQPLPCNEDVVLEINTDAAASEISWEITPDGSSTVLCSGSGYPNNAQIFENCCLAVGCFDLVFTDSFGDGIMPPGGYILRDENGSRIIDANGLYTTTSSVGRPFCLPLGTDELLNVQCDREDFLISDYMIASQNPAVSAEYGGPNEANSGYQFWMFDPHGTYNRRVFYSHANPTNGAQPGPLAAGYLRFQNLQTLPVPTDLDLNVRIRGRINGTNLGFGPACKFKVLSAPLSCPTTQLVDNLSNPNHSCNTIQTFGGSDKVVAWVVPGANFYRFRFVTDAGGWVRNIAGPTNARILNWGTLPLQDGQVYDVSVAVSFDGGANYCPFGEVCTVEIVNPPSASNRSVEAESMGLRIWPNPNNGDLLYLTVDEISAEIDQVHIEIFDMFGKRVLTNSIAVQGNSLNSILNLNSDLSNGIYIANIIIGDQVMTERLIIQ